MKEYLTPDEWARLDDLRHRDSFVRETLHQVERILASEHFLRVQQKPKDFLRYVVAKTLLGKMDEIKETTIAMAVFGESADFNPAETAKVRVAAGDLRQRLAAYARHEGRNDLIEILIPRNTYVPTIRDQRIVVMIAEFENWHPLGEQAHLCEAITAEIAYHLEAANVRAVVCQAPPVGARRRYMLRGSVESREETLRINVSLADPEAGEILCSKSFDGLRNDGLKISREVAHVLLNTLAEVSRNESPASVRVRRQSAD